MLTTQVSWEKNEDLVVFGASIVDFKFFTQQTKAMSDLTCHPHF